MSEEFLNTNLSDNETNCYNNYCVKSTLYLKIMGTIIFVLVWPFIVLDIKWVPLGRPAAALLGGMLMVVLAVTPQDQVYAILGDKGNLQTLFLLIGMMMLSYYYDREGILQYVALIIFGKNKPFKSILWRVCVLTAILAAIITNDAACVVLTPLILTEHMKQGRSKREYPPLLLGIATSANIGSSATFFGNPQNAFIAANSRGQVSLLIFFVTTLPAAIVGMCVSLLLLYLCYYRVIWPRKLEYDDGSVTDSLKDHSRDLTAPETAGFYPGNNPYSSKLHESREELALSYDCSENPLDTSQMSQERQDKFNGNPDTSRLANGHSILPLAKVTDESSFSTYSGTKDTVHKYGTIGRNASDRNNRLNSTKAKPGQASRRQQRNSNRFGSSMSVSDSITLGKVNSKEDSTLVEGKAISQDGMSPTNEGPLWKKKFFIVWLAIVTCLLISLLAIPPPPVIPMEFNLGLVPVGAGILTMFMDSMVNRRYAIDVMMKVDWTMILMFMGLFIWLGGFENTLFPAKAFEFLRSNMDLYRLEGVLLFTVFVVVGSNVLSNVPLVILIMDQLFNFTCGPGNYCTGQLTGVLLAGISTIAGNFTLIGSVANLIVVEKARNITGYRLGFFEYLRFGFISTMMVLIVGVPIMYFAGDGIQI